MANQSVNQLAKNAENLSSDYDNAYTPSSNDGLDLITTALGYDPSLPNFTYSKGGEDIFLGNQGDFAVYDSNWAGYRRQRDIGTGGNEYPCNQFIVARTATMTFYALRDSTTIYKNGTSTATISTAGGSTSFSCTAGDLIGVTRPVGIRSDRYDPGAAYMGWQGFGFAHRQDRYSGTTLFVYAPYSSTNVQLLYTTTDGYVTSLTSQATTTLSGATWTQSMSTTRNYYLAANKPIIAYAYNTDAGSGMEDTLPLYPMDQDSKYGAFSSGGHIAITNNLTQKRAGSTTTQQILVRSSDGTSSTDVNQISAAESAHTDTSPGKTSASLFQGPVQKVQSGNNNLFTCQQQADSNGGEMTPFVSKQAFGKALILTATADWCTVIGESAMTVYRRDSSGRVVVSQTMTGTATYSLYFTRFTNLSAGDVIESDNYMIGYYDANTSLDDERVAIMSDAKMEITYTTANVSGPYGDPGEPCGEGPGDPSPFTAYFVNSFAVDKAAYTDSACTNDLADGFYYNHATNQSFSYTTYRGSAGEGIQDIANC